MIASRRQNKNRWKSQTGQKSEKSDNKQDTRMKCFTCGKVGHRAKFCKNKEKAKTSDGQSTSQKENISFYVFPEAYRISEKPNHDAWCLDSGCTSHMCKCKDSFSGIDKGETGALSLASSASTSISGRGTASTRVTVDGSTKTINLQNTLYVPDLRANLLSVSKITDKGYDVLFKRTCATVLDQDGRKVLTAERINDLYYVQNEDRGSKAREQCNKVGEVSKNTLHDWHMRLGHLNAQYIRDAVKKGSMLGLKVKNINENFECEVCPQGKMCRPLFPKAAERQTSVGDIVHSDVCGPMRIESHGKSRYFCTFIDDRSGWCEVRFLKQKSQVKEEFEKFRAHIVTQQGKNIKVLQSDNGLEYVNKDFDELLARHGISRRLTAPYNPEQNGTAERRNRTLMNMARCLLIEANLPASFWAESIHTANYIISRCPTRKLDGRTPHEIWLGKPPHVSYFRRFGTRVFVMDRTQGKSKLDSRSKSGVFVGYS